MSDIDKVITYKVEAETDHAACAYSLGAYTGLKKLAVDLCVERGHYILSSGLHSDVYIQAARIFEDPEVADAVCTAARWSVHEKLGAFTPTVIVSIAFGGILFGSGLSRVFRREDREVKNVFLERNKDGKLELRRGFTIPEGACVLLVDDVATTGGSMQEAIDVLRQFNPCAIRSYALFCRDEPYARIRLGDHYLECYIDLDADNYTSEEMPPALAALPPIKMGSR